MYRFPVLVIFRSNWNYYCLISQSNILPFVFIVVDLQ